MLSRGTVARVGGRLLWVSLSLFGLVVCNPTVPEPSPTTGGAPSQLPDPPLGGQGGGTGDGQEVLSARGSGLGAGCSVKSDCHGELSCIRGQCQPAKFEIEPTGKECYVTDCSSDDDCCGGLATEFPDKCRKRAAKCLEMLPGCGEGECSRSSDCAGGGSCFGSCSVTNGQCGGNADCLDNLCVDGTCILDFAPCGSGTQCDANVCVGGTCDCSNPSYEPADPVCTDEECQNLCHYVCEGDRCVLPSDCETAEECFGSAPLCEDEKCVECVSGVDCSFDQVCILGRCETPCEDDGSCAVFEACQAGECIYVGCRSDRECTLLPSVELAGLPPATDPRLLRCNTEDGVGRCIVPCQTDAQCPYTEVCVGGVCEYIGCEFDTECKTILGLHDQQASEETPWISTVECRTSASSD